MGRVDGKVAMITGAGGGLGKACMELFAREGARVAGIGRTQSSLDEAVAAVEAQGGHAIAIAADLSDPQAAARAVAETVNHFGRLDILIHTAAVGYSWEEKSPGSMRAVDAIPADKWREVMGLNLDAAFLIAQAAIPQMQKQGGGSIVMVGSAAALRGVPDAHAYAVAKAGVHNLAKQLAVTYVKDGIRTNCLSAGPIDTPMTANLKELFANPATAQMLSPMGRVGTPMEMAHGCLYLASDEASYTNGAILEIDGGLAARL